MLGDQETPARHSTMPSGCFEALAFAAQVQQTYAKAGPDVHVYIQGRTLVIESPTDTDDQVDAAAQQLHAQLQQHGANAKAWVLGFDAIEITNSRHEVRLAPPDPP